MYVEVFARAHAAPGRRLLLAGDARTAVRGRRRADHPAGEGARRSRAAAAALPRGVPRRRRGVRVRPQRRVRPVAADDQPPPEGAPRGRAHRPGQARGLGLLPRQRRRARRPGRPPRRRHRVTSALARRALAELLGTAFLVAAVIGSGIAAQRLSPTDVGLQLLENSIATGVALVALIIAFQPVSASFNPVVTLVERAMGRVRTADAGALIGAQVVGGLVGAVLANLMFDLDAISISGRERDGAG